MKVEKTKLKSISLSNGLASGYSFRGKIHHIPQGDVRIIQLKDIINNYTTIGSECYLIESKKIKSKYFLEQDDILFTAKGTHNYALVYQSKDDIPTIASSALFVIKVDQKIANSHYIAWYINQKVVQNYLKTNEAGTYVTNINKKALEGIPISLPSLEVQKNIGQVAQLHLKEKQLISKINTLKDILITNQLLNTL